MKILKSTPRCLQGNFKVDYEACYSKLIFKNLFEVHLNFQPVFFHSIFLIIVQRNCDPVFDTFRVSKEQKQKSETKFQLFYKNRFNIEM